LPDIRIIVEAVLPNATGQNTQQCPDVTRLSSYLPLGKIIDKLIVSNFYKNIR